MAKSDVYFIFILVIMSSFSSPSHSLTIGGLDISQVVIEGVVYCSLNGFPSAPPASNATAYLTCGGSNTSIAEAVTNPAGAFTIVLNIYKTLLFNPCTCGVGVNYLASGNCFIPVPDGVLSATLTLVRIFLSNNIFTAVFRAGPFISDNIL